MTDLETIKQAAQRLKEARHEAMSIKTPYLPDFSFGSGGATVKAMQEMKVLINQRTRANEKVLAAADPFSDALIKLAEAAQEIAKKEPRKVNRNEAADMACEFSDIVRNALREAAESLKGMG